MKFIPLAAVWSLASAALATGFSPGYADAGHTSRFSVSAGAILSLSGSVDETFRSFYAATGQHEKQALADSYDMDDFNVSPPFPSFSLQYDRRGDFFGFRFDASLFSLSAQTTAKRDYYLGLEDDISYNGKKYDHLKIPAGSDFSIDFVAAVADFILDFTPFTLCLSDSVRLSPSLELGLAVAGGKAEIDAGSPRGVEVYQNPPVDFVVGGSSSPVLGAPAPLLGAGLTLRVGQPGGRLWTSRVNLDGIVYDGSTSFVSGSAREKNADVTFLIASAETSWLFPCRGDSDLSVGARVKYVSLEGDITSKEKDAAAIIAARERFDKSIDFSLLMAEIFLAFSF